MQRSFEDRLAEEARRLKERAEKLKPGPERDLILKKIRQFDVASHVNEWICSPGLRSPD